MLIDWFTVGAQALNFLILVWLLKRYLYKPVLDAIDARENHIADELRLAAAKQTEAQAQLDDFTSKQRAFDQQQGALLAKAAEQNAAERERLLGEVRKQADELRITYVNAMRADEVRLGRQLTHLVTEEVFGIARKALADLATADLEERMGEVFIRRLRTLEGKTKDLMRVALSTSSTPAQLCSSFDLPAPVRATIQNALNETFSEEVRVQFDTVADGICGIEMTVNGQKLAWSLAEYLDALEEKAVALLDSAAGPAAGSAAPSAAAPPAPVAVIRAVAT